MIKKTQLNPYQRVLERLRSRKINAKVTKGFQFTQELWDEFELTLAELKYKPADVIRTMVEDFVHTHRKEKLGALEKIANGATPKANGAIAKNSVSEAPKKKKKVVVVEEDDEEFEANE